jgi:hypothetical protein
MSYKASMACAGAFAAAVTLAGISPIAPAFAHELRLLPLNPAMSGPLKISLLVGHHVEPAFEDSFNAVDVILSTFDGPCPPPMPMFPLASLSIQAEPPGIRSIYRSTRSNFSSPRLPPGHLAVGLPRELSRI